MARVEGGAVTIIADWPGLKNQIDTRSLNFRFEENDIAYEVFAIDGQYFYTTTIYKAGVAPDNQATYDTYRADFESNYKNRITDFNATDPTFLTNVDGYSIVLKDGATPTVNDGYGIAVIGIDGSNYRMLKMDSSGRPVLVGAGTAGVPTGGILTVQGTPTGEPIPITGSISATNPSVSTNDTAIPGSSTLVGGSDGTNLRPLRVFDVDSGGGQQWVLGVGLRKAAGGGSVELGTSSDPIRIDPTGTTVQPVSATQSGTWTVQPGNTANTTPWLITINQGGNSATVTASNALKVDGSAVTQPVSGTVTANAGTGNFTVVQATASNLRAQLASESSTGAAIPSTAVMTGGSDGTNLRAFFVDSSGRQFVVGAAANGAAVAGNPVLIGGSDGTNARTIRTANDGTVRVDPTGTTTQPVSGTVTANAGSGTFTISGTVTANIGTSGSLALDATLAKLTIAQSTALGSNTQALVGGSVTTAAPSYTNGNINPLSLTTAGALRIDGSGVTQPVSGTVAATQSGTWTVQPGNTANTTPWLITINQGGNSATVTASNALKVDGSAVTQPVSGTVTANQGGAPWSQNLTQVASSAVATSATGVQKVGIVGNAGATTDATMAAGTAPTNGFGQLAQYNTSQPAPTNTQTVSAQSDQSGNLLQFPGVQTKTGAAWTSATSINTLQFPTGTATVGAPLGALSVLVQLNQTSTFSAGAVTFQGTYDGTNWVSIPTAQIIHPQTFAQLTNPYTFVASTNQPFLIQLQGFQQIRMNLTSTITGTGSVTPFWTVFSNPPAQAVTTVSGGFGGQVEGRAADGATPVGNPVLVGGYDGTNTQTILTDTLGRIITAPSGAATTAGFSFGDIALSAITTSVVRRTTYNEQTTNAQRSIASSSAADTNTAGTGARQVKITYYDSTGAGPNTETVNLNGTTAVATSNSNICYIEQMEVVSVGSGGANAGTITLFVNNAGGGGTIGTIAVGDNETFWAHHYTPTGKTTYITSISVVINGGAGIFILKSKALNVATAPESQISDFVRESAQAATSTRNYGTAIPVTGPARILMYVITEAGTSLTYRGAFDYYDQ